jgi:predicted deacetylase
MRGLTMRAAHSHLPLREIDPAERRVVVSVHDVTPVFRTELEEIFRVLHRMGVDVRTDLVVPVHGKGPALADDQSGFNDLLRRQRDRGAELGLHGLHHEYAEFLRTDRAWAESAVDRAMEEFRRALGVAPAGFVPPQWLMSRNSLQAVFSRGFEYVATMTALIPAGGAPRPAFPMGYDWGLTAVDRVMLRINDYRSRHTEQRLVRFAVHPMDLRHGLFLPAMAQLARLLERGYRPSTYREEALS